MADSKKKGPLSKKKKDQKTYLYAGGGAVLVGLLYYLYKKHQANTSSSSGTTAAIDPLTGQPYQAGVGSLASSALGTTAETDPLTGQPYQTGVGSLAGLAVDPNTGQTYASEITSLESQLDAGTSSATTTTTPTTTTTTSTPAASRTLAQWTAAATAQLVKFGVTPADAAKALSQYLSGQAISNAHAAQGISNITSPGNALGKPPTSGPAPTVRVAKQPTPKPTVIKVPVQTKAP